MQDNTIGKFVINKSDQFILVDIILINTSNLYNHLYIKLFDHLYINNHL